MVLSCGIVTSILLTGVGNGQAGCDRGCCESLQKCHQLELHTCISNWYLLYIILGTFLEYTLLYIVIKNHLICDFMQSCY